MNLRNSSILLRRSLTADAAISGSTGLLLLFGATLLEGLLGIPAMLMRLAGISLLPFAAAVLYLAKQDSPQRPGVRTVIGLNVGWVVASVLLLLSGWINPTGLGVAFVILQALAVAAFAELQYTALRRT